MLKKNRWFWIVAVIGLILDQVTKYITVQSFEQIGDTFPIIPGVFHFTYVINTGAAFSAFRGGVGWLKWLSLLVSLGLMAFALAGAFGNGIDRFLFGYVVDFLDFRLINFPVFNLADVFINIGIICLLISTFPHKSPRSK
ncbi:MAG: signal peptidase II [Microcystis aeruginosa LL13-03]|nr:signal peptidase II [Microcystis aeruginosa LL13-03]